MNHIARCQLRLVSVIQNFGSDDKAAIAKCTHERRDVRTARMVETAQYPAFRMVKSA
jgi:hypothetical protein